jgi:hypothetical protein
MTARPGGASPKQREARAGAAAPTLTGRGPEGVDPGIQHGEPPASDPQEGCVRPAPVARRTRRARAAGGPGGELRLPLLAPSSASLRRAGRGALAAGFDFRVPRNGDAVDELLFLSSWPEGAALTLRTRLQAGRTSAAWGWTSTREEEGR